MQGTKAITFSHSSFCVFLQCNDLSCLLQLQYQSRSPIIVGKSATLPPNVRSVGDIISSRSHTLSSTGRSVSFEEPHRDAIASNRSIGDCFHRPSEAQVWGKQRTTAVTYWAQIAAKLVRFENEIALRNWVGKNMLSSNFTTVCQLTVVFSLLSVNGNHGKSAQTHTIR